MSYTPPHELLNGLSYDKAECYGKPHVQAFYAYTSIASNRLEENARCAVCGRVATNSHHEPPRRFKTFKLYGQTLRPALIALCGSGTMGCHDGFHGGARYSIRWLWDMDELAELWWSGKLFEQGIKPHARELYLMGGWQITDRLTGEVVWYRP